MTLYLPSYAKAFHSNFRENLKENMLIIYMTSSKKILNPRTNRFVNKNGKLGQEISNGGKPPQQPPQHQQSRPPQPQQSRSPQLINNVTRQIRDQLKDPVALARLAYAFSIKDKDYFAFLQFCQEHKNFYPLLERKETKIT